MLQYLLLRTATIFNLKAKLKSNTEESNVLIVHSYKLSNGHLGQFYLLFLEVSPGRQRCCTGVAGVIIVVSSLLVMFFWKIMSFALKKKLLECCSELWLFLALVLLLLLRIVSLHWIFVFLTLKGNLFFSNGKCS